MADIEEFRRFAPRSKYPWLEWADGTWHRVNSHRFDVPYYSLQAYVYSVGRRFGLDVETRKIEGSGWYGPNVAIKMTDITEDDHD